MEGERSGEGGEGFVPNDPNILEARMSTPDGFIGEEDGMRDGGGGVWVIVRLCEPGAP